MQYKSSVTLFDVPLVHVVLRSAGDARTPCIAKGWIAIGEVAFGILFAAGGVAVGGVSIGGVSVGMLAVAGLSAGVWSAGGVALGVVAFGGAAIAFSAAVGGLAVALEYALGGVAVAAHANDQAARAYFESGDFLRFGDTIVRSRDWIIAAAAGLAALIFTSRRGSDHGRV
jgi:hypothetical protein